MNVCPKKRGERERERGGGVCRGKLCELLCFHVSAQTAHVLVCNGMVVMPEVYEGCFSPKLYFFIFLKGIIINITHLDNCLKNLVQFKSKPTFSSKLNCIH